MASPKNSCGLVVTLVVIATLGFWLPGWSESAERSTGHSDSAFVDFDAWTESYLSESSAERAVELEAVGVQLADERRRALRALIESNPQAALRYAITDRMRQRLPQSVSSYMEDRISGRGRLIVGHGCKPGAHQVFRQVVVNGKSFDAYGPREGWGGTDLQQPMFLQPVTQPVA